MYIKLCPLFIEFNRYKMPGNVIGFPLNGDYPKIVLRTTIYIFFTKKKKLCYEKKKYLLLQNSNPKYFGETFFNSLF